MSAWIPGLRTVRCRTTKRIIAASRECWAIAGGWGAFLLLIAVSAASAHIIWPLAAWILLVIAATTRLLRMGVFSDGMTLICRSWFRSRRVAISEIRGLRLGGYSSFVYWAGESKILFVIVIETTLGREIALPQSVAFNNSAKRQRAVLQRHLGFGRQTSSADNLSQAYAVPSDGSVPHDGQKHVRTVGAPESRADEENRPRIRRPFRLGARIFLLGAWVSGGLVALDIRWAFAAVAFLAISLTLFWVNIRRPS